MDAYSITADALCRLGRDQIPAELRSAKHLIYSSPATLSFNSPGAQGFGVKRAGLAVPGSVMLLVAPACCGRNTAILGDEGGYGDRIFYLQMGETDIVTGRHLTKIPEAVDEVVRLTAPTVVMICITCVDALLGTDMERVCRLAEQKAGVPVRPCYMYALTREGIKPPMTAVRQTVYSLLSPKKKNPRAANLLGFFAPLEESCELYSLLRDVGIQSIREIGGLTEFSEYEQMAEANFNLVLNAEAQYAAMDLEQRLGIPFIQISRVYQIDKISTQYRLLGQALGITFSDATLRQEAEQARTVFAERYAGTRVSVGEVQNANAFELALALTQMGLRVPEIFGTVTPDDFPYFHGLQVCSPETKIYSNLNPSMLGYTPCDTDLALGADAAYYHSGTPHVLWNRERQPFGYRGLMHLLAEMSAALDGNGGNAQ